MCLILLHHMLSLYRQTTPRSYSACRINPDFSTRCAKPFGFGTTATAPSSNMLPGSAAIIRFHRLRHPRELGAPRSKHFCRIWRSMRHVSAATQAQALSAILFLYKRVLNVDLPWLDERGTCTSPEAPAVGALARGGSPRSCCARWRTTGSSRACSTVAAFAYSRPCAFGSRTSNSSGDCRGT